MKSEIMIPVFSTVITALASIGGILYSQSATLELERYKFEQTKIEETRKSRAAALADFAREFATAYQRAAYLIWQVEMMADLLQVKDFATYDRDAKAHQPKLVAAQIMLATYGKSLFDEVAPLLGEYYALDERISVAGRQFRVNRNAGLRALANDVQTIKSFENRVTVALGHVGESLIAEPLASR